MNYSLSKTMHEAMRLMQTGDLHAATAAIQRGLTGADDRSAFHPGYAGSAPVKPWIDAESHVVDVSDLEPATERPDLEPPREIDEPTDGQFQQHSFTCAAGTRRYKLFIPRGHQGRQLPLLIMLHGCTQSPDDFARGTRMNQLAEEEGYCVAYPAQSARDNPTKCWNWFRPADQCRNRGEPAIIAELTRHLVRAYRLDPARVYVAGLSAGAAMAIILARTYPHIYAAAGVHSGLPYGSAHDVPSAFAAMKQGSGSSVADTGPAPQALGAPVPTIVFHGDRDIVVSAHNGDIVIAQSMASLGDSVRADSYGARPQAGRAGRRSRWVFLYPDYAARPTGSCPRRAVVGARRGPCLVRGRSFRFVYRPKGPECVGGNASVFRAPRKEVWQLILRLWRATIRTAHKRVAVCSRSLAR
jgi:poly(hydroxyalkanoate) depolymerase family esterase